MTKKQETSIKLLYALVDGDITFLKKTYTANFTHHNLDTHRPAQPLLDAAAAWSKDAIKPSIEIFRIIEGGDYVFVHSILFFKSIYYATTDILRFEGDQIAEQWDNTSAMQPANPSGHTQMDGPTKVKERELTNQNKKIVLDFQEALVNNDFATTTNLLDPNYVQHSSYSSDGVAGVQKTKAELAKRGLTVEYGKIHHLIGEGNFVFVNSDGFINKAPAVIHDLYRVENKKIVEHWEVNAPMPQKNIEKTS